MIATPSKFSFAMQTQCRQPMRESQERRKVERPLVRIVNQLVIQHPVVVLSAALVIGALIGWVVKRK